MTKEEKILKNYIARIKSSIRLWSEEFQFQPGLDKDIKHNLEAYAKEVNQEQPTEDTIKCNNCDDQGNEWFCEKCYNGACDSMPY